MKKLVLLLLFSFAFILQIQAQLEYVNTCTIAFDDISATGTDLMLGDDQEATITIPFAFTLDGVSSSNLRVGNNGGVLFGVTAGQVTNSSEPTVVGFYPFSDDIDSDYGAVLWETLGTAPNRRVVIMWNDRPHFSNSPSGATFELILHETSNEITFLYQDLDFGVPAFNDGLSAGIRVVGANGFYIYSINTALGGVTCINWFIPSCLSPTSLDALPTSLTDTTISWTAGSNETNWNYEWGVTGFTQGTGNTGTVSATPTLNLMGLTAGVIYDIYIQSDCGGGDTSTFKLLTWTQPNTGDICAEPIIVTLELDCSTATPYLLDYTTAMDLGFFSCDTNANNHGAWFQITAPVSGAINITTTNFMTDIAVFSDCGTQLFCNSALTSSYPLTDLIAGDTYFIALWKDEAITGTSNICFEEITCVFPTVLDATATTATDAEISWIANSTETAWEYVVQVPGSGVPVGAGIATTANPTTVVGTNDVDYEFYVRANCGTGDLSDWSGPFTWIQLVPPVNDDCSGAIPYIDSFTMFTQGNCGTLNVLDLSAATNSIATENPSCDGFNDFGVYYTWKATSAGLTFTSGAGAPGLAIYEAGTCGFLVEVGCINNFSDTIEGLTIGNDYIFHIWDDTTGNVVNFCLEEFASLSPPINDLCANAIPLTPGAIFTDNPLSGTNANATDSGETLPGCASYLGGDSWYSVVVPPDGNITLEMDSDPSGGIEDAGGAVYSGTCGSLVLISCNDNNGSGSYPQINISDINLAGQTIYFRVWEFGNNATINFQVSAYSSTLSLENTIIKGFEYFPNPVNNNLTLRAQNSIQKINVYNMLGQEVIKMMPNTVNSDVDMSSLSQGSYFVKVTINNTTQTIRIIKM